MKGRPIKQDAYNKLLNVIVSIETYNRLKDKAKKEETNMSTIMRKAIRTYLGENIDD